MLACSLAVLCVISRVLSQGKCPPLVEYMYSFGKYYPVCTVTAITSSYLSPLVDNKDLFGVYCPVCPVTGCVAH